MVFPFVLIVGNLPPGIMEFLVPGAIAAGIFGYVLLKYSERFGWL